MNLFYFAPLFLVPSTMKKKALLHSNASRWLMASKKEILYLKQK